MVKESQMRMVQSSLSFLLRLFSLICFHFLCFSGTTKTAGTIILSSGGL